MRVLDRLAHASAWSGHGTAGKAMLSLGLLAVAVGGPQPITPAIGLLVALALALGPARLPARLLLALMAAPAGFLLTGAPMLAVTLRWEEGILPHLGWSADGAWQAAALAVRALAALAAMLLLALTTPAARLVAGLRRLGLPEAVADLALLMYRLLFVLGDTAAAGAQAQAFRLGYRDRRRWLRSLSLLAAGLLGRALNRARRLETGLAARGYDGRLPVLSHGTATTRRQWARAILLPLAVLAAGVLLS